MRVLSKRVVEKIKRENARISIITKMLINSTKLLEPPDAMALLENLYPDSGESCWTGSRYDDEERSLMLSVIVPAYNVEQYICNCLESILRQKVSFPYEVIVINDGSTDATAQLLEQYASYEHFSLFHQDNRGLSAARNRGIECSRGKYLCFVDSDDELLPGALEALVRKAVQTEAMLVVGSYEKRLRNGSLLYTRQLEDKKIGDVGLPGFAHGRIIHYSVFRNLRFPDGYWYEDSIMAQIVHPMCRDCAYTVSYVCYKYFTNEAGISAIAKGDKKSLDSLWITMRLLCERKLFGLEYTQDSYDYFLSMVNLTYHRTKALGPEIAKCVFSVQRMLMDKYYADYRYEDGGKKRKIEEALRSNNFRKYVLACERKN